MNHQLWAMLALDEARQRSDEAERRFRAPLDYSPDPSPGRLRRSMARAFAVISRASASAVRKLDGCIADDLGRSLAPTE